MKYAAYTTVLTALMSMPVYADEFTPAMQSYFEQEIAGWAGDGILIAAITSQNSTTTAFAQSEIDALDIAWRNEVGHADTPTISPVISNAAADYLRERVAASGGRITEIFVMDARGLNVAASDVTSDYWQGDESKFIETHGVGPGAVHISDVELDESTQRYQGQISLTITDPASGQPIGAMTVGVDAEALM